MRQLNPPLVFVTALLILVLGNPPASFGEELATCRRGPVTVLAPQRDRSLACPLAERAAEIHLAVSEDLELRNPAPVSVILATPRLRAQDSPVDPDSLAPWFDGLALSRTKTILVRVHPGRTSADHDTLLAHELTHILIGEEYPHSDAWPRWFQEALAMKQSGEQGLRSRAILSLAAARGRLIPFDLLWSSFPQDQAGSRLAYAQSFSAVAFLISRHGETAFTALLKNLRNLDFEDAFAESYGYSLAAMERDWRRYVRLRYSWIPLVTGGTAFWLLILALFFIALTVRRQRSRELHRQWEEEERREDF